MCTQQIARKIYSRYGVYTVQDYLESILVTLTQSYKTKYSHSYILITGKSYNVVRSQNIIRREVTTYYVRRRTWRSRNSSEAFSSAADVFGASRHSFSDLFHSV